ncbi:hypothetical protein BH23GEM3_BH23GEM3_12260 [soil metagenome]
MRRLQTIGLAVTVLLVLVLAGSLVAGMLSTSGSPGEGPVEAAIDGERLRVEVLNGAGVVGLARSATRVLRERNFDVVYFGNAPAGAQDSSVVIDRVGRLEDARRVAAALGIDAVRSEPDSTLYLEATVILGRDWPTRASSLDGEAAANGL